MKGKNPVNSKREEVADNGRKDWEVSRKEERVDRRRQSKRTGGGRSRKIG